MPVEPKPVAGPKIQLLAGEWKPKRRMYLPLSPELQAKLAQQVVPETIQLRHCRICGGQSVNDCYHASHLSKEVSA